ncbi:hypothetical protein CALVIDRAFT_563092 [Calocera viscosa TUFC12733]|uniref:Uncharacterized protein n=1 Tax=Calocera viscosa (strain TUFC12733) TaxID=1330018 RepID=A0A167N368_CALVF|nr:hypothetical protein CALVIDRAFT_563092 [Calocera viscosa TUFC12733]
MEPSSQPARPRRASRCASASTSAAGLPPARPRLGRRESHSAPGHPRALPPSSSFPPASYRSYHRRNTASIDFPVLCAPSRSTTTTARSSHTRSPSLPATPPHQHTQQLVFAPSSPSAGEEHLEHTTASANEEQALSPPSTPELSYASPSSTPPTTPGFSPPSTPLLSSKPFPSPTDTLSPPPPPRTRTQSTPRRKPTGDHIALPSQPLLRPTTFWKNTYRTALGSPADSPSAQLVRHASFSPSSEFDSSSSPQSSKEDLALALSSGESILSGTEMRRVRARQVDPATSTSSYDYWWPYPPQGAALTTSTTPIITPSQTPTLTSTTDTNDDDSASMTSQPTISSIVSPSFSASSTDSDTDTDSYASDSSTLTDTGLLSASSTASPTASATLAPQQDLSKITLPVPLVYLIPFLLVTSLVLGFAVGWCLARRRRPPSSKGLDEEAFLPPSVYYDSAPPTPAEKPKEKDPFVASSRTSHKGTQLLKHGQRYSISLAPALATSPSPPPASHRRTPSLYSPYSQPSPIPGTPSKLPRHGRSRSTRTQSDAPTPRVKDSPRPSWFRRAIANAVSPRERVPSGLTARMRTRRSASPEEEGEEASARERVSRLLLARQAELPPPPPPPKQNRDPVMPLPLSPPQVMSPALFMGEDYANPSPSVYSLASPPPVGIGLGRPRAGTVGLGRQREEGGPGRLREGSVRGARVRPLEVRKKRGRRESVGLGIQQRLDEE